MSTKYYLDHFVRAKAPGIFVLFFLHCLYNPYFFTKTCSLFLVCVTVQHILVLLICVVQTVVSNISTGSFCLICFKYKVHNDWMSVLCHVEVLYETSFRKSINLLLFDPNRRKGVEPIRIGMKISGQIQ
jgi:mannitol-specific phosphotransferase system IIBC component